MLNIAIFITLSRILLTPVVVFLMVKNVWCAALILFFIAAVTDLLDGFVARRLHQTSKFGQILDPIADKILMGCVMGAMLWLQAKSPILKMVLFFLLIKELILLAGGATLWVRYKKFIVPSVLSRAVSLCEIILIIFLFAIHNQLFVVLQPLVFGFILLNVVLSCWLLLRYVHIVIQIIQGKK